MCNDYFPARKNIFNEGSQNIGQWREVISERKGSQQLCLREE